MPDHRQLSEIHRTDALRLAEEYRRARTPDARLALGRRLLDARARWPRSGPRARPWREFLAVAGIPVRSADRYMQRAAAAGEQATRLWLDEGERNLSAAQALQVVLDAIHHIRRPQAREQVRGAIDALWGREIPATPATPPQQIPATPATAGAPPVATVAETPPAPVAAVAGIALPWDRRWASCTVFRAAHTGTCRICERPIEERALIVAAKGHGAAHETCAQPPRPAPPAPPPPPAPVVEEAPAEPRPDSTDRFGKLEIDDGAPPRSHPN